MAHRKTALVFYSYLSSFVKKDMEILSTDFTVKGFDFHVRNKWLTPFLFSWQKLFLLWNIWSADLIVCQFAGYSSFLPALYSRLWGKPCLIISGGTDTVSFPSIRYGNFFKPLLAMFTRWSYQLSTHLSPKHKTLMWFDYGYQPNDYPHQGILYHCKGLDKPYTEITNGYDSVKWHCTKPKRKNTFLTVCMGWEYGFQYQLKGIDLVVEIAPLFPDCEFIILGAPDAKLVPAKSANVKVLPPAKNEDLIDVFSECSFYLQLSIAEGFPNALCEAMLCECVPIVSDVFSMPEIVNGSGFVLKHKDTAELKALIEKALASDQSTLGKKARQRVADNYTYQLRKEKLLALCNQLVGFHAENAEKQR